MGATRWLAGEVREPAAVRVIAPRYWLISALIIIVLGLQVWALFRPRPTWWPFIDYPLYSAAHGEPIRTVHHRLYGLRANAPVEFFELTADDLGVSWFVYHTQTIPQMFDRPSRVLEEFQRALDRADMPPLQFLMPVRETFALVDSELQEFAERRLVPDRFGRPDRCPMTDHTSTSEPGTTSHQAWAQFWFPTTTAVPLAVSRLVLVPAWLLIFMKPWEELAVALTYDPARIDQAMILGILSFVPVETFHSYEVQRGIWLVTLASGVLATVGLFTRTSLLLFGLGNSVLIGHLWSYGELHHPEALYCVALVLMGLSPAGRCYSIDSWIGRRSKQPERWGPNATMDTSTWALRTVQCLLASPTFLRAARSSSTVGSTG